MERDERVRGPGPLGSRLSHEFLLSELDEIPHGFASSFDDLKHVSDHVLLRLDNMDRM